MKLIMTGLDCKHSELSVREIFALTKEHTKKLLNDFANMKGVGGCVIVSTCNRTEVYVSVEDSSDFKITEKLCCLIGRDYNVYSRYFIERKDDEVIRHLCKVSAGLDSQILGDDQIITQVREAVELSRETSCADSYTETLFKTAIKAAKRIKTEITVRDPKSSSAPFRTIEMLKKLCDISHKQVVVIGNGQMGKMVSELFIKEKAAVTVTIREYKKSTVNVADGVSTIPYSERYCAIEKSNIVVSATTSPHYTIQYEDIAVLKYKPEYIIDLAVPRDVEPCIKDIAGITLFTIDDLADNDDSLLPLEKRLRAEEIIKKDMARYNEWRAYKERQK